MTQQLLRERLSDFPELPGVYQMWDEKGDLLYVGKAKNLRKRLKQYFLEGGDGRPMIPFLMKALHQIEVTVVKTEKEALLLENTLIKKGKPKYNALLKDDKSFFCISIDPKSFWPHLELVRTKKERPKRGRFFGPYPHARAARETFDLAQKLFPLRECSDQELKRRTRPCILYDIGRCLAPCVGKCTTDEYAAVIGSAVRFLEGKQTDVIKTLEEEIEKASEKMEFERAKSLFDALKSLKEVRERQHIENVGDGDADFFAIARKADEVVVTRLEVRDGKLMGAFNTLFSNILEEDVELMESYLIQYYGGLSYRPHEIFIPFLVSDLSAVQEIIGTALKVPQKGRKKELLEIAEMNAQSFLQKERREEEVREKALLELQEKLHLRNYPEWIHCIDQSHISGASAVSVIVAFQNGKKAKNQFRRFIIRQKERQDDYGMLQETLRRHLVRCEEEGMLPDLLLIDGGKGHLSASQEVLDELNILTIDLAAIAKEEGRHDKGIAVEKIYLSSENEPILFSSHAPLLFLLQRIRDEAHRFALAFHHHRRKKEFLGSTLDRINGIGPVKKKKLLAHFKSAKAVFEASKEALIACPGLNAKDVEQILLLQKEKSK